MGVYIAPEIKDRVAVGDDLYQIIDLGGKKKLTPSPTEVSEPGTEINKALLQPMADAIERIDAGFVPYTLYWWRRRKVTSSGDWESVSSPDPDAYPKSGTSGGYDWAYLGTISDAVVNPIKSSFDGITTVDITSDNFYDGAATVAIPYSRYRLWLCKSQKKSMFICGTVDKGKLTGIYMYYYDATGYYEVNCGIGISSISNGMFTTVITDTGIEIKTDNTYHQYVNIAYMPI